MLFYLCRDTVAFLLQCQASTQIADSSGSYPLHLAAWKGDLDIVKLLVERGPSRANVNQQVCIFCAVHDKQMSNIVE